MKSVTILKTDDIDKFDSESLTASGGPYHLLNARTLQSIDSYYLRNMDEQGDKKKKDGQVGDDTGEQKEENIGVQKDESMDDRLFLFQMTFSETHPVYASDIIHVLKKLGFIDKLGEVVLVFVVPRELLGTFKRQKVVPMNTPIGSETSKKIGGIGIGTASVLSKYGVFTIDQLEKNVKLYREQKIIMEATKDKYAWDNAVKCWDDHCQAIQYAVHNDAVANISQYVCALDTELGP